MKITLVVLILSTAAYSLPVHNFIESVLLHKEISRKGLEKECLGNEPVIHRSLSWYRIQGIMVGADIDYVVDRKMEMVHFGAVEQFQMVSTLGKVGCILGEHCSLFASVGTMRWHMKNINDLQVLYFSGYPMTVPLFTADSSSGCMWAVGGSTNIGLTRSVYLGCSGEYREGTPYLNQIVFKQKAFAKFLDGYMSEFRLWYCDEQAKMKYQEIQAAGGIAILCPITEDGRSSGVFYVSGKYAYARCFFNHALDKLEYLLTPLPIVLQSRHCVGLAYGVSLFANGAFSCTVEGRWFDESGVLCNVQMCF